MEHRESAVHCQGLAVAKPCLRPTFQPLGPRSPRKNWPYLISFWVTMSESIVLSPLTWPVVQRQDPSFQLGTLCLDFQINSEDTIPILSPLPCPRPAPLIQLLLFFGSFFNLGHAAGLVHPLYR